MSALGFGSAQIGNLYRAVSEEESFATLTAATAAGVTLFDTAPFYGHGLSELRLGRYLRTLPRASYALSTKIGCYMTPLGDAPSSSVFAAPLPFSFAIDYSAEGTLRSIEQSMLRLGVARFDIVLIHDLDRRNHGEDFERQFRAAVTGAIPTLEALKRSGEIGAIGIAVNEPDIGVRLLAEMNCDYALLAGRYTLLDQSALDVFLPAADARGVAVIMGSVFNSGILAASAATDSFTFEYRAAPDHVQRRVREIERICARYDVALPAVALRFAAAHPAVVSVLVGASRPESMVRSAAAFRQPIPAELWRELIHEQLILPSSPLPRDATGIRAPG